MSGWRLQEYLCESCDRRWESLERAAELPESLPCECGGEGARAISAVREKRVLAWAVSQGKTETPPWAFDTRALAEGMPEAEWRKQCKEREKKAPWYKDPVKAAYEETQRELAKAR